jgi:predicted nuclease with TOPRIM domain
MQRLAEQMREAAQAGDMDAARDKMAELEQMLDELKNVRPEQGRMTERERQRAQQRQRGQQQMNALQDVVQRLGTLLDHAESRAPPLGRGLRLP